MNNLLTASEIEITAGLMGKYRDYNPSQNVLDTFSLFHKLSISMYPPPLWPILVFKNHGCVTNILQSKDLNIIQGERGKSF